MAGKQGSWTPACDKMRRAADPTQRCHHLRRPHAPYALRHIDVPRPHDVPEALHGVGAAHLQRKTRAGAELRGKLLHT
jgi:hypothetical protein